MFINKTEQGENNLISDKLKTLRKQIPLSQRAFAERLQIAGLDIDKNAIQRIECGKRFVTDIEIVKICNVLCITPNDLLDYVNPTAPSKKTQK